MLNGIVFLISLSDIPLLVYRNTTDFYILILYSAYVPYSLMSFSSMVVLGFLGGSVGKNLPVNVEERVQSLGQKAPLEKEMATHVCILAWEISWAEEPGGLESMGSQRVGHN